MIRNFNFVTTISRTILGLFVVVLVLSIIEFEWHLVTFFLHVTVERGRILDVLFDIHGAELLVF